MKIVYHPRYQEVYASDPAAKAGRIESILSAVSPHFKLVTPEPASIDDIKLVHTNWHIANIQRMSETYEVALLAAGGAIKAAELAMGGEPAWRRARIWTYQAAGSPCQPGFLLGVLLLQQYSHLHSQAQGGEEDKQGSDTGF